MHERHVIADARRLGIAPRDLVLALVDGDAEPAAAEGAVEIEAVPP